MTHNLNKVAVIGAGVMGSGIASQFASAGIDTILFDIVPNKLNAKQEEAGLTLEDKEVRYSIVNRGYQMATDKRRGMVYTQDAAKRLSVANLDDDLELLRDCDWIIEVVVERLDIKHDLLTKILPYINDTAVVSTNTSGISIEKIGSVLPANVRERFLGTHFFNPVRYMHLLELIPVADTNAELVEWVRMIGEQRLGKGVVVCKDTPNFIGNRIGGYAVCRTLKAYENYDFNFAQIDQITGPILGRPKTATFKTTDMVGLDILSHVTHTNLSEIQEGSEDLDVYHLPEFYQEMLTNGQLGDKARQGFFRKQVVGGKRTVEMWNPETKEYTAVARDVLPEVAEAMSNRSLDDKLNTIIYGEGKANQFAWEVTRDTLLYAANLATEIADDYRDIDKAMTWGYNWEVGPFEIWDKLGFTRVIERVQADGLTVPNWVLDLAKSDTPYFYSPAEQSKFLDSKYEVIEIEEKGKAAALDMGDGVVLVEFRTVGCSAEAEALNFLRKIIAMVEADPKYKGIVLGNGNKDFCLGVNLPQVVSVIDDTETVTGLSRNYQNTTEMMKFSKKPVVSAVKGRVLGGGVELTIHSARVVASAETYMGFVEAGVGILPAARGCTEMLTRAMETHRRHGCSDAFAPVRKVWEQLAMAKVSKDAYQAREFGYLRDTDRIIFNEDLLLDEAKKEVVRMVEDGYVAPTHQNIKVLGETGYASIKYVAYTMYQGNYMTEYDLEIANKIAYVLTGGHVPNGTIVTEEHIKLLELEAAGKLTENEKTKARMKHMVEKNKPLRN